MKNFLLYKKRSSDTTFEISPPRKKDTIMSMDVVSSNLEENRNYAKEVFSLPENSDIVLRNIEISLKGKRTEAFIMCVEGLTNSSFVNDFLMRSLMSENSDVECFDLSELIEKTLIPQAQFKREKNINAALQSVNIGNAVLFVDTLDTAFVMDMKSWEHRPVGNPENEAVIQGPHEGFNEVLRCNTALIRKTLNTPNLVIENIAVGKTSQTPGALAYLKNVANDSLVDEIKRRISLIDVQYVFSSLDVEQYIEDSSFLPVPQMVTTERPDRVCRALSEGRVAFVLNGSSHVLVMPSTFFDLTTSAEDEYLRYPYSLLIRILRYLAVFLALLFPAIFAALLNFHPQLMLTNILLTVSSSRALVPFGAFVELMLMEVSFELIKEAGIRVPGPIGSTLGIVGGLIIGQAAVEANLVSPIMIIVVAVTGIASFTVPSYSLSFAFRFSRFIFIAAAGFFGLFGISAVLFVMLLAALGTTSFGVPLFAPFAPGSTDRLRLLLGAPIWIRGEKREGYLRPKDMYKKSKISRKWRE